MISIMLYVALAALLYAGGISFMNEPILTFAIVAVVAAIDYLDR